jgi:hypothetical protein
LWHLRLGHPGRHVLRQSLPHLEFTPPTSHPLFVKLVNLANMLDCRLHRPVQCHMYPFSLYTMTFGHLLYSVSLDSSTTLFLSTILLIMFGRFLYAPNLRLLLAS